MVVPTAGQRSRARSARPADGPLGRPAQKEAAEDEHHREALETAEIAGARGGHDQNRGEGHAGFLGDAEVIEGQGDSNELGDDGQRIEEKKIDDAEGAPELAEALEDEAGMANPGI